MENQFDSVAESDRHIIGDAAFPLMPWLLKPYTQRLNMPIKEFNFNYRMSSARMTVENSFGRLKGRWRILLNRSDFSLDNIKAIIKTCLVLHNLCESRRDPYNVVWDAEIVVALAKLPQPEFTLPRR
jgi:hypothetical protein